jgi:hypothetical protein
MKIVILTYESHQANIITHRLLTERPGQVKGIIRSEVNVAGKNLRQSMWFLLRQTGLDFVARKGLEIVLGQAVTTFWGLTGKKPKVPSLAQMGAELSIPIVGAKNINAPQSLSRLQAWQPDLIVSIYLNQLIKSKMIALAPKGVINIHPALLPKNRGLFPYFWALANGDAESGVTVHWVDTKFDTGDILAQQVVPITPADTVISLARRSAEVGAELLVEAVKLIEAGDPPRIFQNHHEASYFSWPTPADVRRFKQRGRRYGSILEMWKDLTA